MGDWGGGDREGPHCQPWETLLLITWAARYHGNVRKFSCDNIQAVRVRREGEEEREGREEGEEGRERGGGREEVRQFFGMINSLYCDCQCFHWL